ncbi:MAG: alpha/beta fold hydrolase [Anaerolineales bacterium]|nr:alpha/beta fold hydrolase [Anaerolineales bacterium]
MNPWSTGNITTHGTKLHYYRGGESKPPIVLAHGITDDGLCWSPVAEVLSGEYEVIMVDLRGHGKSEAPEEDYDLVTMATELSGLITGLGLENPVVMGHSLGAVTAMTLAGFSPDLPLAIILEDPPAFWRTHPPSQEEVDFRDEMRMWFNDLKRKTRDELLEIARSENPVWPEAELSPWADSKHRFSLKITEMIDLQETVPTDFHTLLGQITCPVLLITGDPELGAIVTDEDVAELQEFVPHLQRVHIPGTGHNIRREQYSQYLETLQKFLNQVRM